MNKELRRTRRAAGMTALKLAGMAETSEGRIYAFERGRFPPRPDEARRIAAVLGVNAEELFPTVNFEEDI